MTTTSTAPDATALASLCLSYLSSLSSTMKTAPSPVLSATIADSEALDTAVTALSEALGVHASAENVALNAYYGKAGLGSDEEIVGLEDIVSAGADELKVR
jgi:hypothetical protein